MNPILRIFLFLLLPTLCLGQSTSSGQYVLTAKKTEAHGKEIVRHYSAGKRVWVRDRTRKTIFHEKIFQITDSTLVLKKDTIRISNITFIKRKSYPFIYQGLGILATPIPLMLVPGYAFYAEEGHEHEFTMIYCLVTGGTIILGSANLITGGIVEILTPKFDMKTGAQFFSEKN